MIINDDTDDDIDDTDCTVFKKRFSEYLGLINRPGGL